MKKPARIFFDRNDYQLLEIVDDLLGRGSSSQDLRSLLVEHMHPQGIKTLAASLGLRIAYAITALLGSLEKGSADDRLKALRSLSDEVLLSSSVFYQKNTARVLLQIMKTLVRSQGNELRRLKLAHDFRMVSTGKPRLVRAQLAKYHLLEMPEDWNQYAFDHRVHDANTKGRKSPTHLVMDAWIKGIRHLTVVYYNYVSPEVARELLEAGEILGVSVQLGIEMSTRFRGKYVRFTWEPHGFVESGSFLSFLSKPSMAELMEQGREVSQYQQEYIFQVLDAFNTRHRHTVGDFLQLTVPAVNRDDFLLFVGVGQPSLLHLARFLHTSIASSTTDVAASLVTEERETLLGRLAEVDIDNIIRNYLAPACNPTLHNPNRISDDDQVPDLLRLSPQELLERLLVLHANSRFTLDLGNLSIQDVLELLYACEGRITHIEAYNLKDAAHGLTAGVSGNACISGEAVDLRNPEQHYRLIGDLQQALNTDNVIALKRAIRSIIWDYEDQRLRLAKSIEVLPPESPMKPRLEEEYQLMVERKTELVDILFHLARFHNFYRQRSLGSRVGSGSTGQAEHQHGMGLVVLDTLPNRARKAVLQGRERGSRHLIPVSAHLTRNTHDRSNSETANGSSQPGLLQRLMGKGHKRWIDWTLDDITIHPGENGNIATLGGMGRNGDAQNREKKIESRLRHPLTYLNTNLKNSLKVLIGFVPAFLTFALTKDWWVLAYLGAFIWFGITGCRNIVQSVLGGGGLRRSPLLPWNSLISWSRIADDLLYTGFSVPLLDLLVKTLLLDRTLGITTANNPLILYAVMGLVNGTYISSHNIFRGLPRGAVIGNFFRSILSIPLALLLNTLLATLLALAGVPDVAGVLQKWAAIISKFASDCIAALIEGLADRAGNIRARLTAYRTKIAQLFTVFSRLDLLYPEEDVLSVLESPELVIRTLRDEDREQETLIIVNALDLMYFWMYQPRARKALAGLVAEMSQEEWLIFFRSQLVLKRYREISQVFVDGLVGKNFSKALSFYLDHFEVYLRDLERLGERSRQLRATNNA